MTSNKDIDDLNENRVIHMLNVQQIQLDMVEQAMDVINKTHANFRECTTIDITAISKAVTELCEIVSKMKDGS